MQRNRFCYISYIWKLYKKDECQETSKLHAIKLHLNTVGIGSVPSFSYCPLCFLCPPVCLPFFCLLHVDSTALATQTQIVPTDEIEPLAKLGTTYVLPSVPAK